MITSVGYNPEEVKVGDSKFISVVLKFKTITEDNVVIVAVGYGTLNKKEVTSAITHLSSKDLLTFAGNGALNSIQGKVAGLSVTNTAPADLNSGPNIQLGCSIDTWWKS